MPDCRAIDPLVTPYIDGELSARRAQAVEEHLRACRPCGSGIEAERAVRELFGDGEEPRRATAARRDLSSARCAVSHHGRVASGARSLAAPCADLPGAPG